MSEEELIQIIKNSTEDSWIVQSNRIVYKGDLLVSVTLGSLLTRQGDEYLKDSDWDDTFNEYKCNELITLEFRWNDQIVYPSNWLYKDSIVIPVPVGANMIHEFFKNERDIAALLSGDRSKFEDEMKNTKIYTGDTAVK
ncbi:hypothetical protein [Bacillus thuringiensis]|uniref:Uncharacterized protein n=1 Tax=Bacillus thuringiensis TaxID=1428 RepID=A0A9X6Z384_BACTU|nr:hypothetical protein [Bacillus thuringiensis]MCU5280284.1 hypothetical protein [Bacillus cereus]AMR88455.1 hypothetical protein A3L20_31110 [Bacillus thuringiensis]AMR88488.1 hypothetical protein A3L20_31310 [Bacillus thuringiensis]KIP28992.1 hypothetical protein BG10_1659 [Bacillus thuringiensis serovar morrisoni]MBG9638280.1 hypothetical protein [Bacillus thuringiensis]